MRAALIDLAIIASVASIAYGGWLIAPAAGFILGGGLVLILALGIVRARG